MKPFRKDDELSIICQLLFQTLFPVYNLIIAETTTSALHPLSLKIYFMINYEDSFAAASLAFVIHLYTVAENKAASKFPTLIVATGILKLKTQEQKTLLQKAFRVSVSL